MEAFLSHSPQHLSGGQKQRVSLAGVLVDDVEVLLFDEPLANLDPETGRTAIALIDELARTTDKTIIIIEHRLEDVLSCPVDRILVMQDGAIVSDTTPNELLGTRLLPSLGIRDPLYLAALRLAGCDLSDLGDLSNLDAMPVERCAALLKAWHMRSREEVQPPDRVVQLQVKNLSYSYDGIKPALKALDATIYQGEMVSILGSNGAGKSTLAQLLMGVLKQDGGDIFFEDRLINECSASQRSSMIGFVMQNPNHMISCDLVYDEVAFALRQKGYAEEQIKDRVMDVLGLCALRPYHHWPISALSYGQKKRVTIASILVTQPKVLILDEPTSAQDYQRYTTLMEFLSHLNRTIGLTILFITHDMHLALEYTRRSLVLHEGELLCDKPTNEVFSDEAVLRQANLKVTSLYTLAKRCGIDDIPSFIETFVQTEAKGRGSAADVCSIPRREEEWLETGKKSKPKKKIKKGGRKFGFTLTYEDTDSFLHTLNGVAKLGVFLLWIIFSLTTFDLRFLAFGTACSFLLLIVSRIPLRKFKPYFIGMGTVIALNARFIYLFSPRDAVPGNQDDHHRLTGRSVRIDFGDVVLPGGGLPQVFLNIPHGIVVCQYHESIGVCLFPQPPGCVVQDQLCSCSCPSVPAGSLIQLSEYPSCANGSRGGCFQGCFLGEKSLLCEPDSRPVGAFKPRPDRGDNQCHDPQGIRSDGEADLVSEPEPQSS
jgi:energy-coupling factor transport system ATP-binding protein